MAAPPDWRELLRNIISNPAERDRIANEIGVHAITLTRWVNGETSPRTQNLRQLLLALPKPQQIQFRKSLERVAPDVSNFNLDRSVQEISYKFIMEVFDTYASVPDLLRFWSITRLVLQQALRQLDPERVGMAITVVRCMPPKSGKIHSLRETVGLGTPPWGGDLEEKAFLLGAESLAGHVTVSCRIEQVGDLRSNKTFLPAYQVDHEVSAAASPIMRASRVAGCLLLSSTQPNYFLSETRMALIRGYANLVSLAFEPHEFYSQEQIELHIMPPQEIQRVHFNGFRQRVLKLMQENSQSAHRLASNEAEQIVWQEIEEVLINTMGC